MFNKSYNIAAAERTNKEHSNSFQRLSVKLIDESSESFNISVSAVGQTLLDTVCDCIEIMERDYFGICFTSIDLKTNSSIQKWLKLNKLIRKQLKGDTEIRTLTFRVRFIAADAGQLQETYTRYQLFLQIKQDILTNKILCPKDVAVQLAGLSLQSELGDYHSSSMRAGYISEFRFISDQNSNFEEEVAIFHETLKGIKQDDAELKYLTLAKSLPQYGCDQYTSELQNSKCQFGFNAHGITVFPVDPKETYIVPWNSIDKVTSKSKSFMVKVLLNQPLLTMGQDGAETVLQQTRRASSTATMQMHQKLASQLNFVMPSSDAARETWTCCIETHAFFRVRDHRQLGGGSGGDSGGGGGLRKSHSLFRMGSSVANLFSVRRTMPEILDIRRRTRTIERTFVRTPSKRFSRKTVHGNDKQQHKGAGSINSFGGSNRQKTKTEPAARPAPVESGSSGEESEPSPTATGFRGKTSVTQSVRISRTHNSTGTATAGPAKPFQKGAAHTSLPRKQLKIDSDKTSNDIDLRSLQKPESVKLKPLSQPPIGRQSIHDIKGSSVRPLTKSPSVGSALGSNGGGMTTSNPTLNQSHDRIVDPDSVVDIVMIAADGRYGFTIKGGADCPATNRHVIVTKVSPGSAADSCTPRLCQGDQIIRINDRLADELTNEQIKEIIRSAGQKKDGSLILCVKPRLYFAESPASGSSEDEVEGTERPVPGIQLRNTVSKTTTLSDLRSEMRTLDEALKNGSALQEFEKLYKQKQGLTMNEAKKPENLGKNRYKDILPYDQTRVILRNDEYINANLIEVEVPRVGGSRLSYVAAQGPMRSTSSDFVQLLWEQHVAVVVMLTELTERGRAKCWQYWPEVGDTFRLSGGLQLSCESEDSVCGGVASVRQLRLRRHTEQRRCTLLQYRNWPDHDVPHTTDDFLAFMKTMRQYRSAGKEAPVLVHCSAGIGRTGVVITMDIAMTYLDSRQPFSVLSIVREIRCQRAMLIQSQDQYKFVLRAILHYYSHNIRLPNSNSTSG